MSDLDIGMNDWVCDPLEWDDAHAHDRGKVLDAETLEALEDFGRYKDVDGDAIPYRTLPGTHPTKGAFFTRGSSHDPYATYTEDGQVNAENLDRLHRKFETAAKLMPKPVVRKRGRKTKLAVLNYGSTEPAVQEALDLLKREGYQLNALRLRSFPFPAEVASFVAKHDRVFVVEQNRDAQMRSLLITEAGLPPEKLIPVLNYDGMPLTAAFVKAKIQTAIETNKDVAEALTLSAQTMQ